MVEGRIRVAGREKAGTAEEYRDPEPSKSGNDSVPDVPCPRYDGAPESYPPEVFGLGPGPFDGKTCEGVPNSRAGVVSDGNGASAIGE